MNRMVHFRAMLIKGSAKDDKRFAASITPTLNTMFLAKSAGAALVCDRSCSARLFKDDTNICPCVDLPAASFTLSTGCFRR